MPWGFVFGASRLQVWGAPTGDISDSDVKALGLIRVRPSHSAARQQRTWAYPWQPIMSKVQESRPKRQKTGGRVKGTPNRVTQEFRETVQQLLDDNRENVGRWLTLVAEGDGTEYGRPDPGKALDLLAKLAEFAAPKLSRSDIDAHVKGRLSVTLLPSDVDL